MKHPFYTYQLAYALTVLGNYQDFAVQLIARLVATAVRREYFLFAVQRRAVAENQWYAQLSDAGTHTCDREQRVRIQAPLWDHPNAIGHTRTRLQRRRLSPQLHGSRQHLISENTNYL